MASVVEGLLGHAASVLEQYDREPVVPTRRMVEMLWKDFEGADVPMFETKHLRTAEDYEVLQSQRLLELKEVRDAEKKASLAFIADNEELLRRQYPFEIAMFLSEWYEEVGGYHITYPKKPVPDIYYVVFFTVASPVPKGVPTASSFHSIMGRWLSKLVVEMRDDIKRRLREDEGYRRDVIAGKQSVPVYCWDKVMSPAQSIEYARKWEDDGK